VCGGKAQEMHNSYLGVLGETGLIGGLIMLGCWPMSREDPQVLLWRARSRAGRPHGRASAVRLYAAILMYGMLNYGLRQRHFWFVIALTVAVPHVYGQWRAARASMRAGSTLYGVVPCVE